MSKTIKIYGDEIPPDDFSQEGNTQEKVINYDDQWKESLEQPQTERQRVEAEIAERIIRTIPRPVSAPKQAVPETPCVGSSTASARRKKRWREHHGEEAKRKEREYLREWRKKRKYSTC